MPITSRAKSAVRSLLHSDSRHNDQLDRIQTRLDEIDGRLNHWISALDQINHALVGLQAKMSDAAADVEMAAALTISLERTVAGLGAQGSPGTAPAVEQTSAGER